MALHTYLGRAGAWVGASRACMRGHLREVGRQDKLRLSVELDCRRRALRSVFFYPLPAAARSQRHKHIESGYMFLEKRMIEFGSSSIFFLFICGQLWASGSILHCTCYTQVQ